MEKFIRNSLVLTGAVMGIAVASTPLTSYAATSSDTGNTVVNVNVDGVLAIDAMASDHTIYASPDMVNEGGLLNVTVRSAMPYTISLSAEDTFLTDETESHFIPARSELKVGSVGWGIKKVSEDQYTAIQNSPVVFYDSGEAVADDGAETQFPIGVAINSNTPQGVYTTTIKAIAAVKQQ